MKMKDLLNEGRVITPNDDQPLKDTDTLRVYHGTPDADIVVITVTKGLSGEAKIPRTYSYENNNNPRGLFITTNLDVSKKFGQYVLEFNAQAIDLEAPVWPGGTYTVAGEPSQMFHNDDEREAAIIAQRDKFSKSGDEHIRNSDRPDLAYWLMGGGESQALFTGGLDVGAIRAIWVRKENSITSPYERLKPKEFMKKYKSGEIKVHSDKRIKDVEDRLFKPREKATVEKLIQGLAEEHKDFTPDRILKMLQQEAKREQGIRDLVGQSIWNDRQLEELEADLRDNYGE